MPQGAQAPMAMAALVGHKQSPIMAIDESLLLAVVHSQAVRPLSVNPGLSRMSGFRVSLPETGPAEIHPKRR
jgi:hypothetical protein